MLTLIGTATGYGAWARALELEPAVTGEKQKAKHNLLCLFALLIKKGAAAFSLI
jgi:hypothetical protein